MEITVVGQKIHSQIKGAKNILLVGHQNPDADALGSLMAFSEWFDQLGKTYTKFCLSQPAANLSWLVNFEPLTTDAQLLFNNRYDLVIILDSSDLQYAGVTDILAKFSPRPTVINIDHHFTNQNFGDINLVDSTAVSTSEIIYHLFKLLKIKISPRIASVLLAGIIGDTYNFTNPNTNYQSLATASDLLMAGARLEQVSDSVLKNKTIDTLKIWGKILVRLKYNPELKVVSTVVTENDLKDQSSGQEVTEGVANFLNNLAGVKAALILQQQEPGIIKGSLRTNDDLIDISKLAKMLGGGGHRKAAGFKVKGQLVRTESGQWQIV
ncbi:MAG: bifunctional oligoribonuclease/PAP phosphatase NrnA [Patescibacteria group bacterium]|jgi:phosphoesterase RecJ-like protein